MTELARAFHTKFNQDRPAAPTIPRSELAALRLRLIKEEFKELDVEFQELLRLLRNKSTPTERLVEVMQRLIKETCDLRYVTDGTLVAFGCDHGPYEEVHRSNMSKTPGPTAASKAIKGPDYSPADLNLMFPPIIDLPKDHISYDPHS